MKKITLILMLFVASIGLNAQTWDFTSSNDGWTHLAATQTPNADYWELTSKDGINNPGLKLTPVVPTIDVTAVNVLAITMKNHSATGPTEIRSAMTTTAGTTYFSTPISVGDTEYKTYYIDYDGVARWTGDVTEIKLLFKEAGNINYPGTGAEVFDIDKIEMLNAIPTTEKHVFNFDTDGDFEGWENDNGTLSSATGILTYTPLANWARLTQKRHYVVADDYNWLRIKMKSNSTGDDQLRLISSGGNVSIPITMSDATEQTYEILLDTIGVNLTGTTTWTGNIIGYKLRFSDDSGKSTGTGSFEINSIEFYQAPSLSNQNLAKDDINLKIYPNPVHNSLRVESPIKIEGLEIFNITGQKVIENSGKTINTSSLTKGVYILKVSQEGGMISTKRFIKE